MMRTRKAARNDSGIAAARSRFGGFDVAAAFAGMLAALGLTVLLAGIAGAAGTIGYQRGTSAGDLSTGGLVTGMAVLLISFFVGGWVAGRMSRYDGVLNGLLCALLFVALAGAMSALGNYLDDKYDFFHNVQLPQWFSGADTRAALVTAALGIAVMVIAAALGGAIGSRYHRRADTVIAMGPALGVTQTPEDTRDDEDTREGEPADQPGRHAVH